MTLLRNEDLPQAAGHRVCLDRQNKLNLSPQFYFAFHEQCRQWFPQLNFAAAIVTYVVKKKIIQNSPEYSDIELQMKLIKIGPPARADVF